VDGLWAAEIEGVALIVRAISLQDLVLIHQRFRQTDRRTDDMQSQYRTLHYSASRGKNTAEEIRKKDKLFLRTRAQKSEKNNKK